ncbi:HAD family hydrolase [Paenibacillus tarimensis]|uniref:HAD family hydrolase n=1 Tax=Paenibacillus tarimensis TaxID=416012 RepID=UPI001F169073|nr:HAD family hydrolase [Paenibacillus tarimensis]MCF2945536.1 HAD family hydrolase [Paenibacillus tarimensis]
MIKAVIFDFDGTILDTETPWYDVFCEIYQEHGAEFTREIWGTAVGTQGTDLYAPLEQMLGRKLDRSELRRSQYQKHEAIMRQQSIREGVRQYLDDAKRLGLKIGLASSSERKWVAGFLRQHGLLDYFEVLRTRDDVQKVKPDPELYIQALQALGVTNEEAIAIEDSPNGARAATRAGIRCIAVPNPSTAELPFDELRGIRVESLTSLSLDEAILQLIKS